VIELDREIEVNRPPEAVFAYLSDLSRLPAWQPAVQLAEQTTPGAIGPGTQFRLVFRGPTGPVEAAGEIVEFDRPRRIGLRSVSGPVDLNGGLDFEPTDGGTRLRIRATIDPKGMLRFMEGMIKNTIEREIPAALESLRDQLERDA
jgi:uncharacterized protein YndB with AHSA1/START domain